MGALKFEDTDGGTFFGFVNDDVEYVSPIKFYLDIQIENTKELLDFFFTKLEFKDLSVRFIYEEAFNLMLPIVEKLSQAVLPENFKKLLDSQNKGVQKKLLRGASLTPEILFALLVCAEEKGYKFSEYHFQNVPSNVNVSSLPQMIYLKTNGEVSKVGDTSLSDGQLKAVIEQRKVIVAKVLDRGEEWHCFYLTYKGLAGKEPGEQGHKPHVHYISDKFGISRADLVQKIKHGECPGSPIHIGMLNYSHAEE